MAWLLYTILVPGWFMHFGSAQTNMIIAPSASLPPGASLVVDPSFAGFGIEPSNLFSFMGYDTPNELTRNLLSNLVSYTGYPANVRVGGNTQDYMVFSETQLEWTWVNNPNARDTNAFASDHMLIGPHFYDAIDRLPENTTVTYGINMAYQAPDYAEVLSTLMQQSIQRLKNVQLVSFELGNEPDLWLQNGFRTGSWSGRLYTQQWLDRADILCRQVLLPNNMSCNMFEPGATASTIGIDFQIQDLISFGISQQPSTIDTSYVRQWNQHDYYYFLGVSDYALTMSRFMQLSTTRDQFRAWEEQIAQARASPYRYALREMGIVGPIGLEGITNTFGAALWTLNFFFYAATLNITNVGMHMTDNSNASAWQPIEVYGRQPFVRPLYYAFAAFGQIIGPTCQAQVAALDMGQLPNAYVGYVEAYAVYQNSKLSSVVVINAQVTNQSEPTQSSFTLELQLPSEFADQQLHLAYLSNAGTDATSGTTWNGISFEQSEDGKSSSVHDKGQAVKVGKDGSISITLRDSEAVVAQLDVEVGKIPTNNDACKQMKGYAATQGDQTSTSSGSRASGRSDVTGPVGAGSTYSNMWTSVVVAFLTAFATGSGHGI